MWLPNVPSTVSPVISLFPDVPLPTAAGGLAVVLSAGSLINPAKLFLPAGGWDPKDSCYAVLPADPSEVLTEA